MNAVVVQLPKRNTRKKGIDWDAQPLGLEYDPVIAKSLGVSANTVCYARNKRGIKPYTGPKDDINQARKAVIKALDHFVSLIEKRTRRDVVKEVSKLLNPARR